MDGRRPRIAASVDACTPPSCPEAFDVPGKRNCALLTSRAGFALPSFFEATVWAYRRTQCMHGTGAAGPSFVGSKGIHPANGRKKWRTTQTNTDIQRRSGAGLHAAASYLLPTTKQEVNAAGGLRADLCVLGRIYACLGERARGRWTPRLLLLRRIGEERRRIYGTWSGFMVWAVQGGHAGRQAG